jgi:hypothetical protein
MVAGCLTRKYKTRLEKVARTKHSSSFGLFVSDEEKKFCHLDFWLQKKIAGFDGKVFAQP